MPAVSKKQFRFLQAAAHNPGFAKKAKIKPDVAEEFVSNNIGSKSYKDLPESADSSEPVERFGKLRKKIKAL